jgi:hypothetical protein
LAYKIDAKNQRTDYTYDGFGRTTQAAGVTYYCDQSVWSRAFTELLGTACGKYTTNAIGNLIQVTEPAPEGGNGNDETYYTYNIFNQLTNVDAARRGNADADVQLQPFDRPARLGDQPGERDGYLQLQHEWDAGLQG